MIELGKYAKDKITGFQGIITGHCSYLYGCDTYCLTPPVDKDAKIQESSWFDEGRIEVTGEGIQPEEVRVDKNGAGETPKSTRNNPK